MMSYELRRRLREIIRSHFSRSEFIDVLDGFVDKIRSKHPSIPNFVDITDAGEMAREAIQFSERHDVFHYFLQAIVDERDNLYPELKRMFQNEKFIDQAQRQRRRKIGVNILTSEEMRTEELTLELKDGCTIEKGKIGVLLFYSPQGSVFAEARFNDVLFDLEEITEEVNDTE